MPDDIPPAVQTNYANAVNIKMPAFMEFAVSGWFQMLKAQFSLKNITVEQIKFFHVIASLPPEIVVKLPPSIMTSNLFTPLKEVVIAIYEKTKSELFNKLIENTTMTGRSSYYLQELTVTAAKVDAGDDLIRHQFLKTMPVTVSPILAARRDLTLAQLGKLADELAAPYFQGRQAPVIQTLQLGHSNSQLPRMQPRQHYSGNYQLYQHKWNILYDLRPFNSSQKPIVRNAHPYFGDVGRTCKPWCNWPSKVNFTIQPNSRSSSPAHRSHSEN